MLKIRHRVWGGGGGGVGGWGGGGVGTSSFSAY